jgi:hypothetical protein
MSNLSMIIQDIWGNYFQYKEGKIVELWVNMKYKRKWRKQKINRLYK